MFISVNVTAFTVSQICRNSVIELITEVASSISIALRRKILTSGFI